MSSPSWPTKMKAWQFTTTAGGLEKNLILNNAATPPASLAAGQVLVEVTSAAINPVDYKMAEMPIISRFIYGLPASPGIDFCGRVAASDGMDFKEGQKVFGRLDMPTKFGTLGQFVVVGKEMGAAPEGVDDDSLAAVGTAGMTAYQSLEGGGTPGSKVFINGGSGGCGTWGIQFGKAMGAHVTTSCSTKNVELCKSLGADEVIDYTKQDLVEVLKKKGQVFDLVIDNVGLPLPLYAQCHHFLKPGSKFVQVGTETSLSATAHMAGRMMWPSFLGGGKRPFKFQGGSSKRAEFEQIGKWMSEGKVKAVFDSKMEWEDAPKAIERIKSGRAQGKVIVHTTHTPAPRL